jgi:hypothetical protein
VPASRIPVYSRGRIEAYALVDEVDGERIGALRWNLEPSGYASNKTRVRKLYMHRFVLGIECGDSRQVDHINHDRLDNRRANLRAVTFNENRQNLVPRGGSRYRGVHFNANRAKPWRARVQVSGCSHDLGSFATEIEAAAAAAKFRAEHMTHSVEDPALVRRAA